MHVTESNDPPARLLRTFGNAAARRGGVALRLVPECARPRPGPGVIDHEEFRGGGGGHRHPPRHSETGADHHSRHPIKTCPKWEIKLASYLKRDTQVR
ncbi:hypothetical protein GCM10010208_50900 [Actinomadura livida]|nr:hypothetical protein GCM10010208_50900 [Actinomadura livida]